MKTVNIKPFYIGQEIVAIQDHSQGIFKKGDEFIVHSISNSTCKCKKYLVNIGIFNTTPYLKCGICNIRKLNLDQYWWFSSTSFAPKLQFSEFISIKQVAEEALELIGAN